MSLDMFLIFMIPLFAYGKMTSAFNNSKTTFIVMFSIWIIALSSKCFSVPAVLLETYIFLLFLFVRAVFRNKFQKIKNPILKGIFYA